MALALVLAAALVVPATAARPRGGPWAGGTGQGLPIRLTVTHGNRVTDLTVAFRASCARGPAIEGTATFAGPFAVDGGRFRVRGGELQIRGRFEKRRQASGRLRWRGRSYRPDGSSRACDSGKVRWSAKR